MIPLSVEAGKIPMDLATSSRYTIEDLYDVNPSPMAGIIEMTIPKEDL